MAWILLIIAGLFEIGWPLGFKLASMHSKYFICLCNLDRDRGYRDCSSWNLVFP